MRSLNKAALLSFTTLAAPQLPASTPSSSAAAPAEANGHDLQDFLRPLPPAEFPVSQSESGPEAGAAAPSVMANGHDSDPIPQPSSAASASLPDSKHLPNGTHSRSVADAPANGHGPTLGKDADVQSATAAAHGSQPANGHYPADDLSLGQTNAQHPLVNGDSNGHANVQDRAEQGESQGQASSTAAIGLRHADHNANGAAGNKVVSNGPGELRGDRTDGEQDALIAALNRASLGTGGPFKRQNGHSCSEYGPILIWAFRPACRKRVWFWASQLGGVWI